MIVLKLLKTGFVALCALALLPTFASADVAGGGVIVAVALLPVVLVIAVVAIAAALLVRVIGRRGKDGE
ncbi:MAG: hypothetical protein E7472_00225 [Ruminococcaceae bacterium]|nr:hypothetical protein [Oscillospiraceae bacterium]